MILGNKILSFEYLFLFVRNGLCCC